MKAVKRIVVLGATAGLIMAGAGAAAANDGHSHGKSEKKHSKHHKHHKHGKHGKKVSKRVLVNKNSGAQALVFGSSGTLAGTLVQTPVNTLVNDCGNIGPVSAANVQSASIGTQCNLEQN